LHREYAALRWTNVVRTATRFMEVEVEEEEEEG
jgi:hypothetical protein